MPTEASRASGALSGDGEGHLVRSQVRKERLPKSKDKLAKEAAKVLHQVDKIACVSADRGVHPEKFYTLPSRKKNKAIADYENRRRRSEELGVTTESPPRKPPRTFTHSTPKNNKPSIFHLFTNKRNQSKKSNLKRSVSDATTLKINATKNTRNAESDNEDRQPEKKQLTPIIETTQRDDYFTTTANKENLDDNVIKNRQSVTEKLKEYIDEVDSALFNESEPFVHPIKNRRKVPEVIIIDVDKAEKIEGPNKISKKIKSLVKSKKSKSSDTSIVKQAIHSIEESNRKAVPSEMVHSSQKPVEKIPLTRGLTVDTMVKRLSSDKTSPPPPKTNIMVTPSISVQHNNNQPFSYTRGQSPERISPVIYAHVVCDKPLNGSTPTKQTVHTVYTNGKKHVPHSDSDEGLGNEENSGCGREKSITRFGDDVEDPITPKYNNGYASKTEHTIFIDSSSRGRGDGMDAKRRESLTEPHENGFIHDLSARRDLLESRINSRYYKPTGASTKYVSESSSRYYRQGSASPVGFTERYERETRTDEHGQRHHSSKYDYKHHNGVKQQLFKDREHYKSNPEIVQKGYEYNKYSDSYHDSLKRETYHKDKLGDSGIENDFNRGSSRNDYRRYEPEYCNESEDEGFASSLLIANERQNAEENAKRKTRPGYDSDRSYRERDDRYRNAEGAEYKAAVKNYRSKEYAPRERSIDDGSHYDPRIDKDVEFSTLKKADMKPPKPEKKSGLEKVKQLFTRDSNKKKKDKGKMVAEDNLRARYVEYKSSRENLHEPKAVRKIGHEVKSSYSYNNQRSLTPSPSPTRDVYQNGRSEKPHTSWFKSLDRLSHKKTNKNLKDIASEDDLPTKRTPTKSLRFFGDTDIESNDSIRHKSTTKARSSLALNNHYDRNHSQSSKDLHNTSHERRTPPHSGHKLLHNVTDSDRETKSSRLSMKPPMSPNHRHTTSSHDVVRGRRRRNEVSSVESSTEGDSSQQSQRSVVYLHAATVGDIPGPGYLRNAKSREELASNSSSNIRPQVKTLSRSFSVLAPWKPRHIKEGYDIDYTDYSKPNGTKNGKYEQKVNRSNGYIKKESSSTLKKKAHETRRSNQNLGTLNRSKTRSKESLNKSKDGSSSTLYKKKERQPKENTRYSNSDKRMSSKSMSVESLGNGTARRDDSRGDVSRSVSMPRDPQKSAGWFNINKKNKKSTSTQRL